MSETSDPKSYVPKKTPAALFFNALYVLVFSFLLGFFVFGLFKFWAMTGSLEHWNKAEGILTSQKIVKKSDEGKIYFWPEVEYIYLIDDTLYSGWRYSPEEFYSTDKSKVEQSLTELNSEALEVHWCPNDPGLAALSPKGLSTFDLVWGLIGLLVVAFLLFTFSKGFWTGSFLVRLLFLAAVFLGGAGSWWLQDYADPPHGVLLETGGAAEFQRLLSEGTGS